MPRTGSIASKVGPGGDQHVLAGEQLGRELRLDLLVNLLRFEHAAEPDFAAGLVAAGGAEDGDAVARELGDVALRGLVFPHLAVHRRRHQQCGIRARGTASTSRSSASPWASLARKSAEAGATTIASAPRDSVDVRHVVGDAAVPHVGEDRLAGQRLHGRRRDEAAGGLGHHHLHVGAVLDQQAHEFGGLVGGDAAGDAEHDPPVARLCHEFRPFRQKGPQV